ncbi:MAG: glycerol-3-phosphate 1-O-acyltransferase PlsY [Inhella sp.]|uniref:glycerol-3-phosphate 1-O-acyltransferase PlsY n=1 Tax=Inhella sp. TaxID=1921806 RepID=UPI0022C8C5EA|nr:glycerol-3-phosphate 1-O-acyltransferase PlsY [Inhella sp.]MCZ8236633.1 glycerol-3-phosphate 1-O-acyltransferase PlsY [Inhella sp.]
MNLNLVLAVVAAYLIGSLSFAVITSRLMGLADPRTYGSGNPGATNVLRSGSKAAAIVTLVFDALKGYLPVLAVYLWGQPLGLGVDAAVAVGLAAFLGHLWPVFFKFQGGKGVATAAGVLFALNPLLGVATLASFALIVAFSRFVSLASMVAAAFAPFYQALIWGLGPIVWGTAAMGALLVWRHRANIERLLAGTESKLGAKKNG